MDRALGFRSTKFILKVNKLLPKTIDYILGQISYQEK